MAEKATKGPASAGGKQTTRWKPGQSGNPAGRAPGQSLITKLRAELAQHVPDIVDQLVVAAKGGDVQAARLLLERVLPPVRPVEQPQVMDLPEGDLTAKGHAVLGAAAKGDLAPSQAAALIGAIGALARVAEIDELERRVKALEENHGKS
ncbi:DUF5681 domain-containing protein [Ottowia sp.]|uniref:DUF5681 domain-containing protein n=1 Tax=Ottowia sp. TaxID=1898956 RepID=UPI0039E31AD2